MAIPINCPLATSLAVHLRDQREELVTRWLDRISARVSMNPNLIFPTQDILDHVPLLVDGIADYLEDPADEITADAGVVGKAMELGEMRHAQGFDVYEILKEYEILGGVLFDFLISVADSIDQPCTRGELLVCGHRVFRAVVVIQQYTTTHFLRLADERVKKQEERLRGFNRAVSHELKNQLGAAGGAASMLFDETIPSDPSQTARLRAIVTENLAGIDRTLKQLTELSRLDAEERPTTNVLLPQAAGEVKRALREFAEERSVLIELADDLPDVDVPAAAVELALSNYISNAIKYRDPDADVCRVRVEGSVVVTDIGRELHVRVIDNGLGVPADSRERLFRRFFRAHEQTVTEEDGTGLGLSLVRENIIALGGRTWAEFPAKGSIFGLSIPVDTNSENSNLYPAAVELDRAAGETESIAEGAERLEDAE
jgi:signal transduction histidine kinase